ncbi:MAG: glutamate--tRNA ligase [Thermoguttaceae bacterium]|jgi:glutamyl-tRNA synthetase|nr:glutamate--tRNA ligase [Thermoguttaceae bacterium]
MTRTRFAPSPTGYLHIGGVRTALFCWLFARKHGGQFILRIDDTDQQRNVQEALEPILHGLRWLGIDWDEGPDVGGPHGPYYQSQRWKRYEEAVERLLASGHAYRDYARTEEVQAEREAAQREKRPFVYSRRFMAQSDADARRFESEGRQAVVRLMMPRDGKLVLDDLIRGRVEFDWAQEQDHVIQRADGSCLYHLASTVDDHAMQITHVIRAEEHLSNTPRQVFIAQALGYELPQYAHLPFVAEPGSKTKLSKRKLAKYLKNREFAQLLEHGQRIAARLGLATDPESFNPVIVDFYEQAGYLPEAVLNYLALLGWSLDERTEHFSRDELIGHFSLERVNRAPASFDPAKLSAFQQRHFNQLPAERKAALALPFLQRAGLAPSPAGGDVERFVERVVAAAGDRLRVAGDILDFDEFFVTDEQLAYDPKAVEKRLRKDDAPELLRKYRDRLAALEPFDPATLERDMHDFLAAEGIQVGQIIHAVRVAVTGKQVGLGMFDALALLGRDRCLGRMDRALT